MELNLPAKSNVNKFIPKSKFFKKVIVNTKVKQDFTDKVERITWVYKLAEDTIGISKTDKVEEIQIFEIILKELYIPKSVINVIDRSIPYPILYIFKNREHFAYGISLKTDGKTGNYFSDWDIMIDFDFNGKDLEVVYQNIVKKFLNSAEDMDFEQAVEKDRDIKTVEREIQQLKNKIRKESQFKNKVELNKKLIQLESKYKELL